jgi:hypothetical protein
MMMVVVAVMVPAMPVVMVVVSPVHFRGREPRVLLNRSGGAGIAERQRIRRRGESEQRANGGKPQNFCYLHALISLGRRGFTSAPNRAHRRDAIRRLKLTT